MEEKPDICTICQKPKKSKVSASITQWISTCVCDVVGQESLDLPDYDVCVHCGKRIGEVRKGSFTQFIFRPEFCSCQRPRVKIKREYDFYQSPSNSEDQDEDVYSEESILDLDRSKFPVDRYRPFKLLGKGSGGSVYLCWDSLLSKRVAVKTLHAMEDSQLLAFQEEAKATSRLSHRSIIQAYDFGITEGQVPYMVLEYFKGETLREFLENKGTLDWLMVASIGSEICSALSYSHDFNVFHRDIKPGNILIDLDSDGFPRIKIIDFGVAARVESGRSVLEEERKYVGTPAYMSPDQLKGFDYDARSEVYSLGCVLFELLTGNIPYRGETGLEMIHNHLSEPTPKAIDSADLPDSLSEVIGVAMSKSREDRYASMDEMKLALESSHGDLESSDTLFESSETKNSKNILVLSSISVIFLVFIGMIGTFVTGGFTVLEDKETKIAPVKQKAKKGKRKPKPRKFSDLFRVRFENGMVFVSSMKAINDDDLSLLRAGLDPKTPIFLNLARNQITGRGFKYLIGMPLKCVYLDSCKIEDTSAKYLNRMVSLEELDLTNNGITDKFIENLLPSSRLWRLDISHTKITDQSLSLICRMKNLRSMDLGYTGITDQGLASLKSSLKLEVLDLAGDNNIGNSGLAKISKLPHLIDLDLGFCPWVDRKTMEILATYPTLEHVCLAGEIKARPEDFLLLNLSKSISRLNICELNPVREYLPSLLKLRNISEFNFIGTDLQDSDLPYFSRLPQLKTLSIKLSTNVSSKAMRQLKESLKGKAVLDTDISFGEFGSAGIEALMDPDLGKGK